MSVEAIGPNSSTAPTSAMQAEFKKMRTDFKALSTAMKSGDLAGAQKAYAALQLDQSNMPNQTNTPLGQDISNLGSALSAGDMTGAQKAFATLQQDAQKLHQGHHNHHGKAAAAPESNDSGSTDSPLLVA